ncbi:MAG: carboxypeptidase-like regulatory domain-containing protein [Bacteroidota bacterium]
MMKIIFPILLILGQLTAVGTDVLAQPRELRGSVIDQSTQEPLPFATIGFRNHRVGTVSDQNGNFVLRYEAALAVDTLTISYIGYNDYSFLIGSDADVQILMSPAVFQFEEVVIRSVSAEQYMKKVVRRIPENFLDIPFETVSYYRERLDENQIPIKFAEAGFVSFQHPYFSDSANHHQLVLFEDKSESEMQFLRKKALKRQEKARKKAEASGEEFEDDSDFSTVQANFGGPESILNGDPVRGLSEFMDTTMFKKYRFEFHEATSYNGKPVEVISFQTRGKVDQARANGLIYVDKASLAVIKIEKEGKFVVPFALKPLLYLLGFSISGGKIVSDYKYKSFNGKWYPENLHHQLWIKITKHNMFSKNEYANLKIEQVMSTKEINTNEVAPIVKDKRFDVSKDMDQQVYATQKVTWKTVR